MLGTRKALSSLFYTFSASVSWMFQTMSSGCPAGPEAAARQARNPRRVTCVGTICDCDPRRDVRAGKHQRTWAPYRAFRCPRQLLEGQSHMEDCLR